RAHARARLHLGDPADRPRHHREVHHAMRWQRGSVSVEMAILAPAFLLLIVLGIVHGRVAIAANAIDVAAHDAARAASISRTAAAAEANARAAAGEALQRQGLACVEAPRIDPDVSGFARGGLRLDFVSVTVTC